MPSPIHQNLLPNKNDSQSTTKYGFLLRPNARWVGNRDPAPWGGGAVGRAYTLMCPRPETAGDTWSAPPDGPRGPGWTGVSSKRHRRSGNAVRGGVSTATPKGERPEAIWCSAEPSRLAWRPHVQDELALQSWAVDGARRCALRQRVCRMTDISSGRHSTRTCPQHLPP